jgi:serine/threonine protein kinase
VHGDIKPGNVLIDRAGNVVVTDFGLAQFINASPRNRPWIVGGTAGYLAPEVREGGLPGTLADIFGLGALLWSLVTRSIPHTPLSRNEQGEMPAAIFAICGKCLAVDPRQRFQSVAELLAGLDALE